MGVVWEYFLLTKRSVVYRSGSFLCTRTQTHCLHGSVVCTCTQDPLVYKGPPYVHGAIVYNGPSYVLCSNWLQERILLLLQCALDGTLSKAHVTTELWDLTKTELNMLESLHRKILRTIQGLPTQCPVSAIHLLLSIPPIKFIFLEKILLFLHSILCLHHQCLCKLDESLSK